jgi:hypothetical protein
LNNKKRIESIIIQDIQDSSKSLDSPGRQDSPVDSGDGVGDVIYIRGNNRDTSDNDEYEKI